jgi:mRNA-degrading endonuclease RelE of RelBE toxin-antitoxin system
MSYKVKTISVFDKQAKRLVKKYSSLKSELLFLFNELKTNPEKGISLGNNCYKIRISIASKNSGKSGGARIITHVVVTESTVYFLAIYDKSEVGNISKKELLSLLEFIKK